MPKRINIDSALENWFSPQGDESIMKSLNAKERKHMRQKEFDRTRPEFDEVEFDKYIKQNGIINASDTDRYRRFARHAKIDPYNRIFGPTKEFAFFTKPDLQIFKPGNDILSRSMSNSPLFTYARLRYVDVLKQLSYSNDTSMPFVNLLSNYKVSNIDLPDIGVNNDYETAKNILGSSIFYRGTSYESDENHEFSVEFVDTKRLEVYMFFRLYDEYERMKHYGLLYEPYPKIDADGTYKTFLEKYTFKKVLHDQMSVYKFTVGEDGETIIHFAKFIGVYPKTVPRTAFSDPSDSGEVRFTVSFKASFVEDMDPNILTDFIYLTGLMPKGDPSKGGFIPELGGWSGDWMTRPYITSNKSGVFKLKWEGE